MTLSANNLRYVLVNSFMYAHAPRRRRPLAVFWVLVGAAMIMTLPFIVGNHNEPVSNVSAAEGPTRVQGHVYDSLGSIVYNAQVEVKFMTTSTTWSGQTDENGYYQSGVFGNFEWQVGETIQVKATYGSEQSVNTSLAVDSVAQTVNVTMSLVIPEFGNSSVFLVAVGFSMMFVVALIRWASPS